MPGESRHEDIGRADPIEWFERPFRLLAESGPMVVGVSLEQSLLTVEWWRREAAKATRPDALAA